MPVEKIMTSSICTSPETRFNLAADYNSTIKI